MLQLIDGFDSHAAGGTLSAGNPSFGAQTAVAIVAAVGRFGGKALRLAANTSGSIALNFTPSGGQAAFAGWFKVATLAAADFMYAGSALLSVDATGALIVRDGSGTARITTAAGVLAADTYAWIEVSYRTAGVYLNVNGAPTGTAYVGAYTAPTWASLVALRSTGTNPVITCDDLIAWDASGSYFNAFGVAPRRIQLKNPNADGTPVQWTPNGPTNWQSVTAADWTGGAGVDATAVGQKDRYAFTALTAAPGAIDAVVVRTRAVNTGSDPATITHVMGDGVAEVAGTAQALPGVAGPQASIFYRDVNGIAFTPATADSAEFGQTLGI